MIDISPPKKGSLEVTETDLAARVAVRYSLI